MHLELCQRLGGAADGGDQYAAVGQQLRDALALARVVFDDQQVANVLRKLCFQPLQRLHQLLAAHRLEGVADGTHCQCLV